MMSFIASGSVGMPQEINNERIVPINMPIPNFKESLKRRTEREAEWSQRLGGEYPHIVEAFTQSVFNATLYYLDLSTNPQNELCTAQKSLNFRYSLRIEKLHPVFIECLPEASVIKEWLEVVAAANPPKVKGEWEEKLDKNKLIRPNYTLFNTHLHLIGDAVAAQLSAKFTNLQTKPGNDILKVEASLIDPSRCKSISFASISSSNCEDPIDLQIKAWFVIPAPASKRGLASFFSGSGS